MFWVYNCYRSLSIKKDVTTFHHLGALYHNTGSLEKAAVTFEEALRLQPERVETVCSYVSEVAGARALDTLKRGLPCIKDTFLHPSHRFCPCIKCMGLRKRTR